MRFVQNSQISETAFGLKIEHCPHCQSAWTCPVVSDVTIVVI